MNNALNEYYEALERLKSNKSINVLKGSKINKDTVALEAGRKRGTIKKSRDGHLELILAIERAAQVSDNPVNAQKFQVSKIKQERDYYKEEYEKALGRELMLADRLKKIELKIGAGGLKMLDLDLE